MKYQYITTLLGSFIGIIILILVRRRHLHSGHAAWWLVTAGSIVLFGTFPRFFDQIGFFFGISYPPILLVIFAVCVLFVKILFMDIERTQQEQKIRRLIQKLALLEAEQYPEKK